MNTFSPLATMDCSHESPNCRNAFAKFDPKAVLKDTSMPNIYRLLPNFQHFDSSGYKDTTINSSETKNIAPQHFPVSGWNQTIICLGQRFSNFIDRTTPRTSPGATYKHDPWLRFGREIGQRIDEAKAYVGNFISDATRPRQRVLPCFANISSGGHEQWEPKHVFQLALSTEHVARTLEGVPVFTVSNAENEFVLVSDPNSQRSLGLLCFRQEDAEALLAQVQLRQPVLSRGAKVVPLSLDKVYTLKVEGIAFRFLPDPVQVRNALEIKSKEFVKAFDGVPVFQSDLVVMKKNNRRFCPLYFCKEDLERELLKVLKTQPKASRSSSDIMVGSLEDVLKKMEENKINSGWEDLVFIPPGKSSSEHIQKILV